MLPKIHAFLKTILVLFIINFFSPLFAEELKIIEQGTLVKNTFITEESTQGIHRYIIEISDTEHSGLLTLYSINNDINVAAELFDQAGHSVIYDDNSGLNNEFYISTEVTQGQYTLEITEKENTSAASTFRFTSEFFSFKPNAEDRINTGLNSYGNELAHVLEPYAKLSNFVYDKQTPIATSTGEWHKVVDIPYDGADLAVTYLGGERAEWARIIENAHGFHATVYWNNKSEKVVIAYEGTSDFRDIITDIDNLRKDTEVIEQYHFALRVAQAVVENSPTGNIVATGHSLGGGLAAYAATSLGLTAYTFNAAQITEPLVSFPNKIIQITACSAQCSEFDIVSATGDGLIGRKVNLPLLEFDIDSFGILFITEALDLHGMDNVLSELERHAFYWKSDQLFNFLDTRYPDIFPGKPFIDADISEVKIPGIHADNNDYYHCTWSNGSEVVVGRIEGKNQVLYQSSILNVENWQYATLGGEEPSELDWWYGLSMGLN